MGLSEGRNGVRSGTGEDLDLPEETLVFLQAELKMMKTEKHEMGLDWLGFGGWMS